MMLGNILLFVSFCYAMYKPYNSISVILLFVVAYPQYLFDENSLIHFSVLNDNYMNCLIGMNLGLFLRCLPRLSKTLKRSGVMLLLWIIIQVASGLYFGYPYKYIVMETIPLMFYFAVFYVSLVITNVRRLRSLMMLIILFTVLSSIFVILEYLLEVNTIKRIYGESEGFIQVISGKGQFACFVGISLVVFCFAYRIELITKLIIQHKVVSIMAVIVVLVATILTINRSIFLTYFLYFLLLIFWAFKHGSKVKNKIYKTIFGLISISIVVVFISPFILDTNINPLFYGKVDSAFSGRDEGRLSEYYLASDVMRGPYKYFGKGLGSELMLKYKIGYNEFSEKKVFGFHGIIAHLIIKSGIIGTLIFMILVMIFAFEYVKKCRVRSGNSIQYISNYAYVFLICVLFMSITQNRLYSSKHTFLIGFFVSLPYTLKRLYINNKI